MQQLLPSNKREPRLLVNCTGGLQQIIAPVFLHSYANSVEENVCPSMAKTSAFKVFEVVYCSAYYHQQLL